MSIPSNPFNAPPKHDPYGPQPPNEAGSPMLGIASALIGVVAWICCCGLFSIPLSLGSIVLGHLAVRKPASQTLGVIGLILGYSSLLKGLFFLFVPFHFGPPGIDIPQPDSPGKAAFLKAESTISAGNKDDYADGNSPEAKIAAKEFADLMKKMRDEFFTPDNRKGFSLTDGAFVTWCELHEGECCFLVHVPGYRKFSRDAKQSLNELAWTAAQGIARKHVGGDGTVALGMKGVLLYDLVRIGYLDPDPAEETEITYDGKDKDELEIFFEPEAPDEPGEAMPAEPKPMPDPEEPKPDAEPPAEPPPASEPPPADSAPAP